LAVWFATRARHLICIRAAAGQCVPRRQAIVRAILQACADLGIDVMAEEVETVAEYRWFLEAGVRLFQGYFFAKPGFQCLPAVRLS
jgi:EAL domain-containing protein (putative c-di-GMP-specific phosphodiesterase class I)